MFIAGIPENTEKYKEEENTHVLLLSERITINVSVYVFVILFSAHRYDHYVHIYKPFK